MLRFVSPGWLWGLGALVVPIVIHLLSRGSSPTLPLGTLRFLDRSKTRTARRIRLTEPGLLAVRCFVLALLSLVLADPVRWREKKSDPSRVGRLLVDPVLAVQGEVQGDLADLIEERRAAGWEVSFLGAGLSSFQVGLAGDRRITVDNQLWSLAREAIWQEPPGTPIEFITSARVASVSGERPRLPEGATWRVWQSDSDAEEGNRWIESVRGAHSDEPRVLVARSRAGGTSFDRARPDEFSVAPGAKEEELDFALANSGGEWRGDDVLRVPRFSKAARVAVVAGGSRELDRGYLEAALKALSTALPFDVEVESRTPDSPTEASVELLFWLSDQAPPADVRSRVSPGGILVLDGGELWEDCAGMVAAGNLRFEVLRCADPVLDGLRVEASSMMPVWKLRDGRVLLAAARSDAGVLYGFASRFAPEWSSLVDSPVLLEWLQEMIVEVAPPGLVQSGETGGSDLSAMAPVFFSPGAGTTGIPRQREADRRLAYLLWALLGAALIGERVLAGRRAASGAWAQDTPKG